MHTQRLDHIAVAVRDLDAAIPLYQTVWGARLEKRETMADWGVEVAHLDVAGTSVELIRPLDPTSAIARFIDKKGESLHHLAFRVDDLRAALTELSNEGIRSLDESPRKGAHGTRVAFLHPKHTGGILTELVESGSGH